MIESVLRQNLACIEANRACSSPLPKGTAPLTSSDSFKIGSFLGKPEAKRWDHRFSVEARDQHASTLKASAKVQNSSSMLSLSIARPSPELFPWNSITMTGGSNHLLRGTRRDEPMTCIRAEEAYDLNVALNYGFSTGSPQLLRFVTEHTELLHKPPYADWGCCLTCGSTSALEIALRLFCSRGDWILAEKYTYSGAADCVRSQGLQIAGVEMDGLGLMPEALDQTLRAWDTSQGKKPSVLYMIPTGQNPTGTSQSLERRNAIYRIAEHHDLYIMEDDPYFYLQLDRTSSSMLVRKSVDAYVERLPASYLSLDRSGRVLRMDSTSKILAPGLRCGWITASSQVIEKFVSHSELGTQCPSGPSQVMLFKLLEEKWGHEGFLSWLSHLSWQYSQRLSMLADLCSRHLPPTICSWTMPHAGMFLWIRLDLSKHPQLPSDDASENKLEDFRLNVERRVHTNSRENGVMVSRGSWFATKGERPLVVFIRLTFAAAPVKSLAEAVIRFGAAIRSEFAED